MGSRSLPANTNVLNLGLLLVSSGPASVFDYNASIALGSQTLLSGGESRGIAADDLGSRDTGRAHAPDPDSDTLPLNGRELWLGVWHGVRGCASGRCEVDRAIRDLLPTGRAADCRRWLRLLRARDRGGDRACEHARDRDRRHAAAQHPSAFRLRSAHESRLD